MTEAVATRQEPGLLADKVIVIVGASTGIGAAAARLFADEGAVLMLGARSEDRLAELVEELRARGADAAYRRCDIGSSADTSALVADTVARYGRLDGAFNNAGVTGGGHGRLADIPEERFDELSRVNFKGIWLAMRAEIPHCRATPTPARSSTPAASAAYEAARTSAHTRPPNEQSSASRRRPLTTTAETG
jgi:NAD(P)-dependent dehydrogenase (short-subunit alcohol dehydrogenase family)